jgi:branched-chain amino acid transport system permease protein
VTTAAAATRRLAQMRSQNALSTGLAAAIFLGLAVLPSIWKPYLVSQLLLLIAIADLAILWNLVSGYGGQLSLAHGSFFGIGAYSVAYLGTQLNYPIWLAIVAGVLVSVVLAVVITLATLRFRIRGTYFALVTLAVALMLRDAVTGSDRLGGAVGLTLPWVDRPFQLQFSSPFPTYYVLATGGFLLFLLSRWFVRSPMGIVLRAIRDDETAAESIGHDLGRSLASAMGGTAAIASVIGSLYTLAILQASPDTSLSLGLVFAMLIATIVGGIGTLWGPIVGALFYQGSNIAVSQLSSGTGRIPILINIAFGIVLIAVVVVRPNGLMGRRSNQQR